ncbi:MAG TPA: hypothetical protein VGO94_01510 [Mycobacteriales bacterium]|nr:hypothetical protein [Mycobacteriales bacterium]
MALAKGRTRRAPGQPSKLLQGWVGVDIHDKARRGAAARGVSIARYLELLVDGDEVADTWKPEPDDQLRYDEARAS